MRSNPALLAFGTAALLTLCCTPIAAQCDLQWAPGDGLPGTDNTVYASTMWDPDGAGPAADLLVIGGSFNRVGPIAARGVAAFDPVSGVWTAFGQGMGVSSLAVLSNGDLVAGGTLSTPGGTLIDHVGRWDGTSWVPLGFGVAGTVSVVRVLPNGDLLVGGDFTTAGGVPAASLAVWNGTSWAQFGTALTAVSGTPQVQALAELPSGDVVVAGRFSGAGGVAASSIARWDGAAWHAFGGGIPVIGLNRVRALHVLANGDLLAGGVFPIVDGVQVNSVARWDGAAWQALGGGIPLSGLIFSEGVWSFSTRANGDIVVGGFFTVAGSVALKGIARYDGAAWAALGDVGYTYTQVALPNGDLIAGGDFTGRGKNVSRWDGSAWHPLADGFDDSIQRLARLPNGDIVAGGFFNYAVTTPAARIAVFDGTMWSPLGSGLTSTATNPFASQLAVAPNGDLFVAGTFQRAGGVLAGNIARWDGSTWWPLTSGTAPTASALLVMANGDVVIAGNFSNVTGVSASNVARWDGVGWHALGSGLSGGPARALAEMPNGDLVAAGTFTTAGGVAASKVARWNGSVWAPMGAGLSGSPGRLVVMPNGDLVAMGTFGLGQRWNGSAWSSFAAGLAAEPTTVLALPNGDLLVGGQATLLNLAGSPFVSMARWSGGAWAPLSGMPDGRVYSMVHQADGSVVVGGTFTEAGGLGSTYFARLDPTCPATALAYGAGCTGPGGALALTASNLPWTGATFEAKATGLGPASFGLVMLSLGQVLPGVFSINPNLLGIVPGPGIGCDLLIASLDYNTGLVPVAGTATWALPLAPIQVDPTLPGLTFYLQVAELDFSAGWVGTYTTNALTCTVGAF